MKNKKLFITLILIIALTIVSAGFFGKFYYSYIEHFGGGWIGDQITLQYYFGVPLALLFFTGLLSWLILNLNKIKIKLISLLALIGILLIIASFRYIGSLLLLFLFGIVFAQLIILLSNKFTKQAS